MKTRDIGIFEYLDRFPDIKQEKLPLTLQLPTSSDEAILLRLLLGQIDLKKDNGHIIKQRANYSTLPFTPKTSLTYKSIDNAFSGGDQPFNVNKNFKLVNNYFNSNRKNHNIHEKCLFEISAYFASKSQSSIAAFTHLYRCLEFMAYSFPMLYAAKSRDYKGTFGDLKKFFAGGGELGFFHKFLSTLFEDEKTTLNYEFEIDLKISHSIEVLKKNCETIYKDFPVEIDILTTNSGVLHIQFKNMLDFFIGTRNHYFHMLAGQTQDNFFSTEYDISEYFDSINPHILNWLSIIIQKILVFGFYSSSTGL